MARNGITATAGQRQRAGEMIYRALTITIPLGPERSIPGLHRCKNVISEMEFLFPFPEDIHSALSDPRPGKLVIERGIYQGIRRPGRRARGPRLFRGLEERRPSVV